MKTKEATTKANNRRYYLKQKLKDVLIVNTHKREVAITPGLVDGLPQNKKRWLNELGNKFGYNLQNRIV